MERHVGRQTVVPFRPCASSAAWPKCPCLWPTTVGRPAKRVIREPRYYATSMPIGAVLAVVRRHPHHPPPSSSERQDTARGNGMAAVAQRRAHEAGPVTVQCRSSVFNCCHGIAGAWQLNINCIMAKLRNLEKRYKDAGPVQVQSLRAADHPRWGVPNVQPSSSKRFWLHRAELSTQPPI